MKFCSKCDNMYYIKISNDKLVNYCRKCKNEEEMPDDSINSISVSKTHIKHKEGSFKHLINEYTKYDPTLPQINHIKCPNDDCPSNVGKTPGEESKTGETALKAKNKILYIRYDSDNMKYLYLCVNCDQVWESSKKDK